jgi:hypothetical protein
MSHQNFKRTITSTKSITFAIELKMDTSAVVIIVHINLD